MGFFRKSQNKLSDNKNRYGNMEKMNMDISSTLKKTSKDSVFLNIKYVPESLHVWRVNKGALEELKPDDIGQFYDGDSYLTLNIRAKEGSTDLIYDIFMWIGKYSTIDEYTFLALKSIELDNSILERRGIQHREVQDNETCKFLSLFPNFEIMKGGYEPKGSKLIQVGENNAPTAKLFLVSGYKKYVKIVEVSYRFENLNSDDVFIIDKGKIVYQVNGKNANLAEKMFATCRIQQWKINRNYFQIEVIDETEKGFNHPAISEMPIKHKATIRKKQKSKEVTKLYRLSDESGKLESTFVRKAPLKMSHFDSKDAFIVDAANVCYVWIGKNTSQNEKHFALIYGNIFLADCGKFQTPLETIREGEETNHFMKILK